MCFVASCSGVEHPTDTYPYSCQLSIDYTGAQSDTLPTAHQVITAQPSWNKDTGKLELHNNHVTSPFPVFSTWKILSNLCVAVFLSIPIKVHGSCF